MCIRDRVRLGALAAGNYEFDLVYIPAGASEPSKHRIGVISQGATTPGYYYTRNYTVSVPYQAVSYTHLIWPMTSASAPSTMRWDRRCGRSTAPAP